MFAQLQRGQSRKGMRVFASADDDRIEFIRVIKNAAKICVSSGFRVLLSGFVEIIGVHIAESRDMFRRHRLQITASSPAATNHGDAKFLLC